MLKIPKLPLKKPTFKEYAAQVRTMYTADFKQTRKVCSEALTLAYSKTGIDTADLHRELHSKYGDLFNQTL